MTPHTATLAGQTVAYLKAGTGPAIVLIHGLGGHKEDFARVIDLLAPHHTVLAPDMLGFGGSARSAPSFGPGAQADAIAALLDHEGIARASLAGNSAGGWTAAILAARHPDRVVNLALIDPAGLRVTLAGPPPVNFAPTELAEMQALLRVTIASGFARTPEFAAQALAAFTASGEAATLAALFAGFASHHNPDPVLDDVLADIAAPTAVIWGAEDGLFPVALADIVIAGLPAGAKRVVIPGASHFVQIDAPEALASELLAFFA